MYLCQSLYHSISSSSVSLSCLLHPPIPMIFFLHLLTTSLSFFPSSHLPHPQFFSPSSPQPPLQWSLPLETKDSFPSLCLLFIFLSFSVKDSESFFSFHQFSTLILSCSLFFFLYPATPPPCLYDSNMFQLRCGSAEKGRWLTLPVSSLLSHLWPVRWLKPTVHTTLVTVAWFVEQRKNGAKIIGSARY